MAQIMLIHSTFLIHLPFLKHMDWFWTCWDSSSYFQFLLYLSLKVFTARCFYWLSSIQSEFSQSLFLVLFIAAIMHTDSVPAAPVIHATFDDMPCLSQFLYKIRNTLLSVGALCIVLRSSWCDGTPPLPKHLKKRVREHSLSQAPFAEPKYFAESQQEHWMRNVSSPVTQDRNERIKNSNFIQSAWGTKERQHKKFYQACDEK